MKKEIAELLNSSNATLKINTYCTLHRWTHSPAEGTVDKLEVTFSLNSAFSHSYDIGARDLKGIVAEIQEAQTKAFADAAEMYNRAIAGGTLLGTVKHW